MGSSLGAGVAKSSAAPRETESQRLRGRYFQPRASGTVGRAGRSGFACLRAGGAARRTPPGIARDAEPAAGSQGCQVSSDNLACHPGGFLPSPALSSGSPGGRHIPRVGFP